jgi:hypothetical protein
MLLNYEITLYEVFGDQIKHWTLKNTPNFPGILQKIVSENRGMPYIDLQDKNM